MTKEAEKGDPGNEVASESELISDVIRCRSRDLSLAKPYIDSGLTLFT